MSFFRRRSVSLADQYYPVADLGGTYEHRSGDLGHGTFVLRPFDDATPSEATRNHMDDNATNSRYDQSPHVTSDDKYRLLSTPAKINGTVSIHSLESNPKTERSWRAPMIMLTSLLLGLISAIGHHEMYSYLNGKVVDTPPVYLSQQWISRFSTAFTFLVKTCFVTCVGLAFVQRQWLRFSHHSVKVKDFDTISGVLGNIFEVFDSIWLSNPLLGTLALISWTIPLAVIVIPGSLSVAPLPSNSTILDTIAHPAYKNSGAYIQSACCGREGELWESPAVSRIALATATSGQTYPMTPPYANLTYSTSFTGPALKCHNANDTFTRNVTLSVNNGGTDPYTTQFLSWTGSLNYALQERVFSPWGCEPDAANGCSIFVMSALGKHSLTNASDLYSVWTTNVTECRLQNATYSVDFEYQNYIQTAAVTGLDYLNPVWDYDNDDPINFNGPTPFDKNEAQSYYGILSAYGNLLVGVGGSDQYGSDRIQTHYDLLNIDWTRSETMTAGLQELFQNITLGLLAHQGLLDNSTTLYPKNVIEWNNTYVYNQLELIIPYSVAFVVAFICFLIGMHSFFASGASYQNNFSTFVRAANATDLKDSIAVGDTGAAPLPKKIGKRTIQLGGHNSLG